MATRTITVCDRHKDDRTEAVHHNTWTNPQGKQRQNDLCQEHQVEFLRAWEAIEDGSSPVATVPVSSKGGTSSRKAAPAAKSEPTETALIRAWAQKVGEPVSEQGRVSFTVERKWKLAGKPNVLGP